MAIAEAFSGTATITTTEHDLCNNNTTKSTQTTDGIYQLFLDLNNLTDAESYRLRIYEKVLSSGIQRIIDDTIISGTQSEPVYVTSALLLMHGWTFTLTKLQGTSQAISWSIRQVA